MADSVTWRTPGTRRHHGGIGDRISGAICAAVFGILIFLAAFPLLWWNEGRAVKTSESLDEAQSALVVLSVGQFDRKAVDKLVYVRDRLDTDAPLTDKDFGISVSAVALQRKVETYQWRESRSEKKETNYDGTESTVTTAHYSKGWDEGLADSSTFREQYGHQNPSRPHFESRSVIANQVLVGQLRLHSSLVSKINNYETVELENQPEPEPVHLNDRHRDGDETKDSVSEKEKDSDIGVGQKKRRVKVKEAKVNDKDQPLVSRLSAVDNYYYTSDALYPSVGDSRVRFEAAGMTTGPRGEAQVVSVIGRLRRGGSIDKYHTVRGGTVAMLTIGSATPAEMFDGARTENTVITWLLRLGGFLAMFIGLSMMSAIVSVLTSWIPIIGTLISVGLGIGNFMLALALSCVTAALAWWAFRPVLSVMLICVAMGALWLKSKGQQAPVQGQE